jgi:hypothetical protein
MRKLIRFAVAIGIVTFLVIRAPDFIRNAADNLRGQAGAMMPVAMR